MFYIIVINGKPQSGKDTFVELFKKNVDENETVYNISTIDISKEVLKFLSQGNKSIVDEKPAYVRDFLSEFKELSDRYFNTSFNYVDEQIKKLQHSKNKNTFLFVHCREPENIKKLAETYKNVTTLLIRNSAKDMIETTNSSDSNVYNYDYDYEIENNDGLEDIEKESLKFYEYLNLNKKPIFKKLSNFIKEGSPFLLTLNIPCCGNITFFIKNVTEAKQYLDKKYFEDNGIRILDCKKKHIWNSEKVLWDNEKV